MKEGPPNRSIFSAPLTQAFYIERLRLLFDPDRFLKHPSKALTTQYLGNCPIL
jgi:hypothetical protein